MIMEKLIRKDRNKTASRGGREHNAVSAHRVDGQHRGKASSGLSADDTRLGRNDRRTDRATGTEKTRMLTSKRVEGQVEYNDGEFAEIQTIGIEGIEKDLWLDTIQIHRDDTDNTPEEFQRRFPVGMRLGILTTTEITKKRVRRTSQASSALPVSPEL
jgi:hypothetical protein